MYLFFFFVNEQYKNVTVGFGVYTQVLWVQGSPLLLSLKTLYWSPPPCLLLPFHNFMADDDLLD